MQIRFTGGVRGLASFVADLEGAGIAASYTRPEEARSGDITPMTVVIVVGGFAATQFVGGALSEAGKDVYRATVKVVGERRERKLGDAVIEGEEQVDLVAGSEQHSALENAGSSAPFYGEGLLVGVRVAVSGQGRHQPKGGLVNPCLRTIVKGEV